MALVLAASSVGCSADDKAATATPTPSEAGELLAYRSALPPEPSPSPSAPAVVQAPREPRDRDGGPSGQSWQRAGELVARMSLEQRAGHVIVGTYGGLEPPVDLVRDLGLAGVILMGDNVPSGSDSGAALARTAARLQAALDRPYPLIVSVDQEGGTVARVGPPATQFRPAWRTVRPTTPT